MSIPSMRCPVSASPLRRLITSKTRQNLPQGRKFGSKSGQAKLQSPSRQLRVSHPCRTYSGRSLESSGISRPTTLLRLPSSSTPTSSVSLNFSQSLKYIPIRYCSSKSATQNLDDSSIEASEPQRENSDEMPSGQYYQFLLSHDLLPHYSLLYCSVDLRSTAKHGNRCCNSSQYHHPHSILPWRSTFEAF